MTSTAYPIALVGIDAQNGDPGTAIEREPPGYDGPPYAPLYNHD